ncbi:glycosyltransferase [Ulvibacter sp. MAR_2010_11]|uniref:glycosyltransferase n=1 Tax=Ulvibacter sp. MAR_2010_11 TaxID=1250229 RepID=UPI001E32FDE4|nr:glycosyltransferase [Ulvibacter sp. MAR_2010_11]
MRKKDILLITNYFPPEKGAAANRMHSLAAALSNNNYSVTIVCPLPNYPNGKIQTAYKGSFYSKSVEHGMSISRLWIWPSNSKNTFLRLLSMFSFSISLHFYFLFKKIPKVVVVQYSPIFIGVTAVFWARILNKRIVLNVSDLWPKAGLEMGLLKRGFYYSVLEKMEYFCYRKSNLILGQSEEILTHIGKLYPAKDTFLYRNFPNFNSSSLTYEDASRSITIVYAGLLG